MSNLRKETIEVLYLLCDGKKPSDIRWCRVLTKNANPEVYDPWIKPTMDVSADEFFRWTDEHFSDYDSGYGGQEVPSGTLVVGDDWWLERHEYDGSEWWEFKTMPKRGA